MSRKAIRLGRPDWNALRGVRVTVLGSVRLGTVVLLVAGIALVGCWAGGANLVR
jgi:hypothetical protein